MAAVKFPSPDLADASGLLMIGGDLEVATLVRAYRRGVFPWPVVEGVLTWFCPPRRTVLYLDDFRVSRSLRQLLGQGRFNVTMNRDFAGVIGKCAEVVNRGRQGGTWITPEMIAAYIRLHQTGYAHSVETWQDGELVGGLYGVAVGGAFSGESMFYRVSNASKLAIWHLVEHLRDKGVAWIDCQVMTPLLKSFGAVEAPREEFLAMLTEAVERHVQLF